MTAAVVGASVPVFHSPSSFDLSGRRFSPNVSLYVSLHSLLSPSFSSSRLRKSGRRSRRRVVEAREGSSFVCFSYKELAHDNAELEGRQRASERNARFTRTPLQEEPSISSSRISSTSPDEEGKLPWALHRGRARGVKASATHQSRGSKYSKFAHTSESYSGDDFKDNFIVRNREEAFHKQSRSPPDVQYYNGSFVAKKHPRAPLPSQDQQTRLHNEATIFEGITEPRTLGFPGYNHTHPRSLRENADDALPDIKEQVSGLNLERSEPRQNIQKGTRFMLKLEEELLSLKKKNNTSPQSNSIMKDAERGDNASSTHAARLPRGLTREGKEAQVNGAQVYSRGEDTQSARHNDFGEARMLPKKSAGDEAGFTSFNLFSSSPSVIWEADSSHPSTYLPITKNRRPSGRHFPTSIGSRSRPSQRSVTNRNKGHPKFGSQVTSGGDGALEVSRGETKSDDTYAMRLKDDKVKTQVASCKGAVRVEEQGGSYVKRESHAASDVNDLVESGKRKELLEPWPSGKKDIITHSALKSKKYKLRTQVVSRNGSEQVERLFDWSDSDEEEEVDNGWSTNVTAEKVRPLKSSPLAMSLHNIHNHHDSESEDDTEDVFELPFSDAKGNASASSLANEDTQSNFRDDKVSVVSSDAEENVPSSSGSGKVDGSNAYDTSQVNSSRGSPHYKKRILPDSEDWHKHDLPDLPFEFQFSYSETPERPILGYRETPFSPFGPSYMKRPWIGHAPKKPSKKKPRVFDSFHPPPKDIKGVKHVQDPGPYPDGQGPKAAISREEIIGEPLTKEEIVYLVEKCQRESRQLNIGRDGLTHNMLDLIHSHWKRRRVCKIKCKGVPTVDMDNLKFHIEDKTGGKIIYHTGGILYLFRGRNYNYKDRPHIPLMLWKPATPIYPNLIQPAPEGLTKEEAQRLRQLGRKVKPICKLGKNGVYFTLVNEVRAAFTVDELVRVDCRGLNPSDYKKIGAKLRDLVPCVLLSFDKDHILMWKGKQERLEEGASMLQASNLETIPSNDSEARSGNTCNDAEHPDPSIDKGDEKVLRLSPIAQDPYEAGSNLLASLNAFSPHREENSRKEVNSVPTMVVAEVCEHDDERGDDARSYATSQELSNFKSTPKTSVEELVTLEALPSSSAMHQVEDYRDTFDGLSAKKGQIDEGSGSQFDYAVDIDALWEHAFQSGMAIELSKEERDDDLIVRKADELALSAPLAPRYTVSLIYKLQLKRDPDYKPKDELRIHFSKVTSQKPKKEVKRKFKLPTVGVPGMGGLPVDDLAKLLVKE